MAKKDTKAGNLTQALDLLNRALKLEYSLIAHYPRLASAIKDEEIREMVLNLGSASIKHADVVANAISKLGGNPLWSLESFPEQLSITDIFREQMEKEKLALQLHQQNARLLTDTTLSNSFNELAKEEEDHIQIIGEILSRLGY